MPLDGRMLDSGRGALAIASDDARGLAVVAVEHDTDASVQQQKLSLSERKYLLQYLTKLLHGADRIQYALTG